MNVFETGDQVTWAVGNSTGQGRIVKRFTEDVAGTLMGSETMRPATAEYPVFLIEQEDGTEVLKSQIELSPA